MINNTKLDKIMNIFVDNFGMNEVFFNLNTWLDNLHSFTGGNGGSLNYLHKILIIMIIFTVILFFVPQHDHDSFQIMAIVWSWFFFAITLDIALRFDRTETEYQFGSIIPIISSMGIDHTTGVDGTGICFLLLTTLIAPICVLSVVSLNFNVRQLVFYINLIEILLFACFSTTNAFFFFVFFESLLPPMFILIGSWGLRPRKIKASFYFFLYTAVGSYFMLTGLFYIYSITGSFEYEVLFSYPFSFQQQCIIFVLFFVPFAIKVPMYPAHLWLPEAHVEAGTVGSVLLASLLLKVGFYGLIRFPLSMAPEACEFFQPIIIIGSILSIIYAALMAIVNDDMKRIIAFSSIAHMNLSVLGLFSFTAEGIQGAIYLNLAHGFATAGLFFLVGVLYERFGSRSIKHYSGLTMTMPLFSIMFFIFTFANMAFPGTFNFVGEILLFVGIGKQSSFSLLLAGTGIVLSAIYSLWLYNRVSSGSLKNPRQNIQMYADLNRPEFYILVILALFLLVGGVSAGFITSFLEIPIKLILERFH